MVTHITSWKNHKKFSVSPDQTSISFFIAECWNVPERKWLVHEKEGWSFWKKVDLSKGVVVLKKMAVYRTEYDRRCTELLTPLVLVARRISDLLPPNSESCCKSLYLHYWDVTWFYGLLQTPMDSKHVKSGIWGKNSKILPDNIMYFFPINCVIFYYFNI